MRFLLPGAKFHVGFSKKEIEVWNGGGVGGFQNGHQFLDGLVGAFAQAGFARGEVF